MRWLFLCVFAFVAITGTAHAADCNDAASAFLRDATPERYVGVKGRTSCWFTLNSSLTSRNQLTELARRGNERALLFVASVVPKLDGGELEDALRILGASLDTHPKLLLELFANGIVSRHDLSVASASIPERYRDDSQGAAAFMRRRLASIEAVDEARLASAKTVSTGFIQDAIAESERPGQDQR